MVEIEMVPLSAEAKGVLADLADGWFLETINGGTRLIKEASVSTSAVDELLSFTTYLEQFVNCGGYRISDEGRSAYIKSTDELGDGEIYRAKHFLTGPE